MLRHFKRPALQATNALSKMVLNDSQRIIPKGRTFSVQYSLPKLPIPPLDQTLRKYLDTCRPLLTDQQYQATEEIVKKFEKDEGAKLQKLLEERAQNHVNWLSDWWKNVAYLDGREPIVVNVNPCGLLPRQKYSGQKEMIDYAAKFVAGILDYKLMLDEQRFPVDALAGKPLCMDQYYQLLNACRIPGVKRDSHVCIGPNDPNQPRHINVIHNNHIFSVDVYGSKGKPLSVEQLKQQLQDCVTQSQVPAAPVGLLTTMDRSSWGQVYASMIKDKTNKASLENIQTSIMMVCLDGPYAAVDGLSAANVAACTLLHGGGSKAYSANRWFDKTVQIIVNPEGFSGFNYEHTTAEAQAIVSLCDSALSFIERNEEPWVGATDFQHPQRLTFNISPKIMDVINKGAAEIDSVVEDLMLRLLIFDGYGKNFIKQHKMSPDAYIQMAIQLAYYRMYKQPCATYESGTLRRFQLGRTDTIRSCSIASHAFTHGMDDPSVSEAKKLDLLKKAIQAHRKYTDETIAGQGIDRHLLGLKLTALENGMDIPQIFMDLAFKESTHYRISSSQVAAKYASTMCFGPVVPDGYGVCYNPRDDQIVMSVSSYNNSPQTNSDLFTNTITKCFHDMQKLLASQTPSKL